MSNSKDLSDSIEKLLSSFSSDKETKKRNSIRKKIEKVQSEIKALNLRKLALIKEKKKLEEKINIELKPIFHKKELLSKYFE